MMLTGLVALMAVTVTPGADDGYVLVEAESLATKGGWVVDQQFMDLMGSPYLLAHGLGVPVLDAVGEASFSQPGKYRVWVRTRDWVAPWKAPGAPGKFQLLIDGTPLSTTFGTEGDPWHWQDGGIATVGAKAKIALHDLTGFEGRCDAILFSRDLERRPPDGGKELAALRAKKLGWNLDPEDGGSFDLVVVGGGIAGTSTAISAARQGLSVALIQDRPVLGGNGSSEVRVWPEGHINLPPYPRVGDIVRELLPPPGTKKGNAVEATSYDDALKLKVARAEKNLTLLLNQRVNAATKEGTRAATVVAQHTHTGRRTRIAGKLFVDATGDGVLGQIVGADGEVMPSGNMGASNLWNVGDVTQNEPQIACLCKDLDPVSINFTKSEKEQPFPRCPWAVDLSKQPFPGRKGNAGQGSENKGLLSQLGGWYWESGFEFHPIDDMERVRDYNLRAMYGAWDALKNVDKLHANHRLKWAAYIAGKRESRRLLGDVILTADDFRKLTPWPDPAFPCTWHIDLHDPDPRYVGKELLEAFISRCTNGKEYHYKGPYWAPYRCLYSRNIDNLFMVGRDISCSHDGLGAVRVMRTCGMMGETVGRAAWIAMRHQTTPRGVYDRYLPLLKELMAQPGALRRESIDGPLLLPAGMTVPPLPSGDGLDPTKLAGIVIDDKSAKLTGSWTEGTGLAGYVAAGYRYSSDKKAMATFAFKVPADGDYEVRLAWQPHANRAKSAKVEVETADGVRELTIDQTKTAKAAGFEPIGKYRFAKDRPAAVRFKVAGAGGMVHIDAVQVVAANGARK
ncbi:MAG TPA: FAD-dependent oxidoreductase [Planctomycetia bacterium]|nr:FAD-dependent oxidoreductase [Planctomycetia bacterium]